MAGNTDPVVERAMQQWGGEWIEFSFSAELSADAMLKVRNGICAMLKLHPDEFIKRAVWEGCNQGRAMLILRQVVDFLPMTTCYGWNKEIWDAGVAGGEAFKDHRVKEADLPEGAQLWLFENQLTFGEAGDEFFGLPRGHNLIGKLIWRSTGMKGKGKAWAERTGRVGVTLADLFVIQRELEGATLEKDPFGCLPVFRIWPTVWVEERATPLYGQVIAAQRFMALPFISVEAPPMSRQQRRHYERKHREPPPVRVVTLRKRGHGGREEGEESDREWSCRWLVHGHWRKRAEAWAPGEPSYVRPYVKGPDDKPFRAPRETVYRVTR